MMRLVRTNLGVHMKFFRRNRLLLLMVLILAVFSLPILSVQMLSMGDKFRSVQIAVMFASTICELLGALLGLIVYSHHFSGRSLKMVFTKPCPPEVWLLSAFLAGGTVLLALHILILLGSLALFAAWGLAIQWGVVLVVAHSLFSAFLLFGWMLFLTLMMPPVAAGAIGLMVNTSMLHWILQRLMISGSEEGWFATAAQAALKYIVMILYVLLPETSPYQNELKTLMESFRFDAHSLGYVATSGAYVLMACALFFCASIALLRRRNLS
jgi:ABC-type transport system involved in multi-copper enzyme maturation permease subunit